MKKFPGLMVKLVPIVVVAAVVMFCSSSLFSDKMHSDVLLQLKQSLALMGPVLLNLGSAFVVVYTGFLTFHPLRCGFQRCLDSAGDRLHARGRRFWMLFFQAAFWCTIGVIACRIVAPGFVDSALLSSSIVMGVIGLAAQNEVKNVIASVFLHSAPKCEVGVYVKIIGSEGAEGVITQIDYLSTTLDVKGEGKRLIIVPNSTVWNNSVLLGKPEKEEKKKDDRIVVEVRCCGHHVSGDAAETSGCASCLAAPASETSDAAVAPLDGSGPRSANAGIGGEERRSARADSEPTDPRGPRSCHADSHD